MTRVIIQAGGKGTRLLPYTTILPKPLMPIQDVPILEIVIKQLVWRGFTEITITTGHLGHLIMAVIGNGEKWGATIDYLWEDQPQGTIGAIRQAQSGSAPFLVMNGDLLTDINYRDFWEAHCRSNCLLSVGVFYKEVPVSLGVLDLTDQQRVVGFREKPVLSFPCSMGIYAFQPEVLSLIPDQGPFGFDDLMECCLGQSIAVNAYPFHGLWLDIGRTEDYDSATQVFRENRDRLIPPERNGDD